MIRMLIRKQLYHYHNVTNNCLTGHCTSYKKDDFWKMEKIKWINHKTICSKLMKMDLNIEVFQSNET